MGRAGGEGQGYLQDLFTDEGQPGSVVVKARDAQDWTTLKKCHENSIGRGLPNRKRRPTKKIFEVGDPTDRTPDETVQPVKTEKKRLKGPRPPSIILDTYGGGHHGNSAAFSWDSYGGSVTQPYVGEEDCENKHQSNKKDQDQVQNQDQYQNHDQVQNLEEEPKQEQEQEYSKLAQDLEKPKVPTQALPENQDQCAEEKVTENEPTTDLDIRTCEDVGNTQGKLAPQIHSMRNEGPQSMLEDKIKEDYPPMHQLYGMLSHLLHLTVAAVSYIFNWLPSKQDLLPQNLTVEDGEIVVDVFLEENNLNEISIDLL
jgi:hypothetical protein